MTFFDTPGHLRAARKCPNFSLYTKEISSFYTKRPENVQFNDQQYTVKKTWKIGKKRNDDMTRADFIKELENVNMIDVNQYKSSNLKEKIKKFTLENDLQQFHLIVQKLRTQSLFSITNVSQDQVFKSSFLPLVLRSQ